jgi:hypothetical protein
VACSPNALPGDGLPDGDRFQQAVADALRRPWNKMPAARGLPHALVRAPAASGVGGSPHGFCRIAAGEIVKAQQNKEETVWPMVSMPLD